MAKNTPKRPRDANQLGKLIVDLATGEAQEEVSEETGKNPHAVALGRLGGLKGGNARAAVLSSERRQEIARNAAEMRWNKNKPKEE